MLLFHVGYEASMGSWQARVADRAIRILVRRRSWGDEEALARRARRIFGAPAPYARWVALGLRCERVERDGVRGEWITPPEFRPGVILYLHGGGFVSCSAATHRPITAALSRLTQRRVFAVDYRLAPEWRLPAAHEDVSAAYEWLRETGVSPSSIAVAGDSAGGNLALALAIRLRDSGGPTLGCVVAFSPWTDLAGRGESVRSNAGRCAMFHPENILDFASAALGARRADLADVSPGVAELHDLPPVLIYVGSTELLLDDARRVHEGIRRSGGACDLRIYDSVPHGWQMLAPFVPEATHSLREAATFVDDALHGRLPPRGVLVPD